MRMTSNPNDLSARVKNRIEADRGQIEAATTSELRRLGESLRAVVSDELRTIEADTAAATARTSLLLLNAWLRPLVDGLIVFVGISGGSWGLMHWLSVSIQSRIGTLVPLEVQIEHARETLDSWISCATSQPKTTD